MELARKPAAVNKQERGAYSQLKSGSKGSFKSYTLDTKYQNILAMIESEYDMFVQQNIIEGTTLTSLSIIELMKKNENIFIKKVPTDFINTVT